MNWAPTWKTSPPNAASPSNRSSACIWRLPTGSTCWGLRPGFPFIGGLDPALVMPRRASPRTHIPPGSVGIARDQTCIYPLETPGGWNLIGRTPVRLFDPIANPPCLLAPGDSVRFVRIDEPSYHALLEARS